jgi:hypothetical protein
MNTPLLLEYTQLVKRIDDAENNDPKFKELKERLRAAVAFTHRADGDEIVLALRAENEAISALILHVHS